MIILTGGAGFIGSVILRYLNDAGEKEILVVDEKDISDRKKNLTNKVYSDYMDKDSFLTAVKKNSFKNTRAIIHMGACSSTTMMDEEYLNRNNFLYTRDLAIYCVNYGIHFLYASSAATYGNGENGYSDNDENIEKLKPLNLYGKSKQDFDLWAKRNNLLNKITGFKFFNVFGPNENHKGEMRSLPSKAYDEIMRTGKISLFKSHRDGYGNGEQRRDFVYVKDAVDAVMYFFKHKEISGIYNIGTGKANTWNALARALFKAMGLPEKIDYIDMPDNIKEHYQYFTEADTSKLVKSGYGINFRTIEESILDYTQYLRENKTL